MSWFRYLAYRPIHFIPDLSGNGNHLIQRDPKRAPVMKRAWFAWLTALGKRG